MKNAEAKFAYLLGNHCLKGASLATWNIIRANGRDEVRVD